MVVKFSENSRQMTYECADSPSELIFTRNATDLWRVSGLVTPRDLSDIAQGLTFGTSIRARWNLIHVHGTVETDPIFWPPPTCTS
jgi:hypothetical protein